MSYSVKIKKVAEKFIQNQSKDTQSRILKVLSDFPPPSGVKKLKGKGNGKYFLVRVGDLRIIFTMDNEDKIVFIEAIGNRGQVYKDF